MALRLGLIPPRQVTGLHYANEKAEQLLKESARA
jgi:hypothetical protein